MKCLHVRAIPYRVREYYQILPHSKQPDSACLLEALLTAFAPGSLSCPQQMRRSLPCRATQRESKESWVSVTPRGSQLRLGQSIE